MQQIQDQNINIEQEEYILCFETSDGSSAQIRINENIRNRLDALKNISMEQGTLEIPNAPKFRTSVYKNLQNYIDVHYQDSDYKTHQKLPQFSNRLQDIIGERDFKIIESLKRQDLIELTRFAEFLMFEDLVNLLMTVILFHLAGKNKAKIAKWLQDE